MGCQREMRFMNYLDLHRMDTLSKVSINDILGPRLDRSKRMRLLYWNADVYQASLSVGSSFEVNLYTRELKNGPPKV